MRAILRSTTARVAWVAAVAALGAAVMFRPAVAAESPLLAPLRVDASEFSPGFDGRADAVVLATTLAREAAVAARVTTPDGRVVRELWAGQRAPDELTLSWDGSSDAGTPVADGRYVLRVQATEAGAAPLEHLASVRVDRARPQLAVPRRMSHLDNLGAVRIPVRLSEPAEVRVTVSHRSGRREFLRIIPAGRQVVSVRVPDALVGKRRAGSYRVAVSATDAAWNRRARTLTVRVKARPRPVVASTLLPRWLRPVMVRATAGAGVPAEWARSRALAQLLLHESSFDPRAQNPTSTAYGLFQFLDQTWATVGCRKTSDPYRQSVCGLRYIKRRYRTPERAWAFWQAQSPHWY